MMTKSIQQEIAPTQTPTSGPSAEPTTVVRATAEKVTPVPATESAAKAQAPVKPSPASQNDSNGITAAGAETTSEEREIFGVLKRICGESPLQVPIRYKDGTNFFAVNLGSTRSWFLRLFAGSRRKSFVARLPIAQVEPLVSGCLLYTSRCV